jgi:hypothetical protein
VCISRRCFLNDKNNTRVRVKDDISTAEVVWRRITQNESRIMLLYAYFKLASSLLNE